MLLHDWSYNILFSPDDGGGGLAEGGEPSAAPTGDVPSPAPGVEPGAGADQGATAPPDAQPTEGDAAGSPPAPPEGWPEGVPFEAGDAPIGIEALLEQEQQQVDPLPEDHPMLAQMQGKLDYYQSNLDQALTQLQAVQEQLREYEMAGLDEGEAAQLQLNQERQALEQERQALVEATWKRDLHQFYAQYVPENVITSAGDDPAQWQAAAFKHMQSSIATLYTQNKALRKALTGKLGSGAPNVPAPGGGSAPTTTPLREMSLEDREKLYRQADRGLLDWSNIK